MEYIYKFILYLIIFLIIIIMIHNIFFTIEKYSDFNCDLIPNSDVCTIKIKGDKGENGQVGNKGYMGLKGTKGDKGLSGFSGLNGKEIPNIEFKELHTNILLGEYNSYDSNDDTKTIHINKGSIGNTAYIPALKFIYNDRSELYINPNNSDSDSYIEVDLRKVKGIKGDTGDDGYCTEALKGDKGDNGTKGPQGVEGEPGKDGPMGDPGNDGPTKKNTKYKRVNSKKYCFKNIEQKPICITTNNNKLDGLRSIQDMDFNENSVLSTSTAYNSEPINGPFTDKYIPCKCGFKNDGNDKCVDDAEFYQYWEPNGEGRCGIISNNIATNNIGWNDVSSSIKLPPYSLISIYTGPNYTGECSDYESGAEAVYYNYPSTHDHNTNSIKLNENCNGDKQKWVTKT